MRQLGAKSIIIAKSLFAFDFYSNLALTDSGAEQAYQ